jgi:hypothetical protein
MLFFLKGAAQTHAAEYYEFDRLHKMMKGYYNRGLYHNAILYPDSLAGNKYVAAKDYYFFARLYSLSNDFNKTLFYLEKAVKGGITKLQIAQLYDLDAFRASNMHIIYEVNYDKWHKVALLAAQSIAVDSAYVKAIQRINFAYAQDIQVRRVDGDAVYAVKDTAVFYATKRHVDSIRFYALVQLTLAKGVPTYNTIGDFFNSYYRGLRHCIPANYNENCADWQALKSMVFIEMEKGNLYPFYYASIVDYIRLSNAQPLVYGTLTSFDQPPDEVVQFEAPEELNMRRRAVGLCSFQLELWSEARELPESLKAIDFK